MVKVQHGWQSHNISELEQLTSNQGSPISAGSDQPRLPAHAISMDPLAESQGFMQPAVRTPRLPDYDSRLPQVATATAAYGDRQKENTNYSVPAQTRASYESFWRDHEEGGGPNARRAQNSASGEPFLAPPVDILPRGSGRLETTTRQPPALRTNMYCPTGHLNPRTPSPKKQPKMRTPSQQAAVEKDAVETLLFMSSPGNSDYRPHTAPSGTPLRSEFTPQASRTSHTSIYTIQEAGPPSSQPGRIPLPSHTQPQQQPPSSRQLSDAEINKMLDEMPDTSSSDDETLQEPSRTPFRPTR